MKPVLLALALVLVGLGSADATPAGLVVGEPVTGGPAWAVPADPRVTLLMAAEQAGLDPEEVRRLAVVPDPSTSPEAAYVRLAKVTGRDLDHLPLPPGRIADALLPLLDAVRHAVTLRQEAVSGLGDADLATLMRLDAAWRDSRQQDDRSRLQGAWADAGRDLPQALDRTRIAAGAHLLLDAALVHGPRLEAVAPSWDQEIAAESCLYGDVGIVVCGPGDDDVRGDFLLAVDLGGNDIHRTNAGASGIGILWGGTTGLPAALALDVDGDDVYTGEAQLQGAGSSTPGVLVDLAGADVYSSSARSFNFAQGAGNLGGVGILHDAGGDDHYLTPSGRLCATCPTAWDSQGFGILGGIGILHDADGDDEAVGGTMAQGVGDFDAVGIFVDESGNDYHEAVQRSQGFGDGLGLGMMLSGTGNGYWILSEHTGQGAGLSGTGVLLSLEGNDHYRAGASARGFGAEYKVYKPINDLLDILRARAPGVGVFVDLMGSDGYTGTGCDGCQWGDGGLGLDV